MFNKMLIKQYKKIKNVYSYMQIFNKSKNEHVR